MGIKIKVEKANMNDPMMKRAAKLAEVMDRQYVLDNVIRRVVQEGYREGRDDIVRKPFLDLEVQYVVKMCEDKYVGTSAVVTKGMLDRFSISEDELDKHCEANEKDGGFYCCSLFTELSNMRSNKSNTESNSDIADMIRSAVRELPIELPLILLSNKTKCKGAFVMMHPWVLRMLADELKAETLIILPSSVDEVFALGAKDGTISKQDLKSLRDVVREVNSTGVAPEERLSDSVYIYDAVKNTLEIAPQ